MPKKAIETKRIDPFDYLKDKKVTHTLLDVTNFKFDEKEIAPAIELALNFSIEGKSPDEAISDFIEYLLQNKIKSDTRDAIKNAIGNILTLNEQEMHSANLKIDSIVEKEIGKMNNVQSNLFEQFLLILSDTILKVRKDKLQIKNSDEFKEEIQKKNLERLMQGIEVAMEYWQKVFLLELPTSPTFKAIIDQKKFSTIRKAPVQEQLKWVLDIFKKLQKNSQGCEFLKVITGAVKAEQLEFEELHEKAKCWEKKLVDENDFYLIEDKNQNKNQSQTEKKGKWRRLKKIIRAEDGSTKEIIVDQTMRSKSIFRLITKMLKDPAFYPQTAVKDGIGLRFEVKTREDAIAIIQDFFKKNGGVLNKNAYNFSLRTKKLLKDEFEDFNSLKSDSCLPNNFQKVTLDPSHKSDFFEDVKIIGTAENGISFEIQFVLVGNSNETGLAHHSIYEQIGTAQAKARVSGFINEAELQKYADFAYKESTDLQALEDEIKKELQAEGKKNPNNAIIKQRLTQKIKDKKQGIMRRLKENTIEFEAGKYIYVDPKEGFKYRLLNTDLIPSDVQEKIKHCGFNKWVESCQFNNIFSLDPPEKNESKKPPVSSFEGLPGELRKDLFFSWASPIKEHQNLFKIMEQRKLLKQKHQQNEQMLKDKHSEEFNNLKKEQSEKFENTQQKQLKEREDVTKKKRKVSLKIETHKKLLGEHIQALEELQKAQHKESQILYKKQNEEIQKLKEKQSEERTILIYEQMGEFKKEIKTIQELSKAIGKKKEEKKS